LNKRGGKVHQHLFNLIARSEQMKPARFLSLAFLILIFAFSTLSYARVPQMINYQGKLTTPEGALIDDTLSIVFTIYDAPTDGGVLWTETQATVIVEKGIFTVLLGSVNPIPDTVFTGDVRYLGVKVEADPEMTPRKEIVSVGYAYKAEYADTAAHAQVAVSDGDCVFRITDTADTTLMMGGEWGIARSGNVLYGNADSTHVNLGVACTTGSSGENLRYSTVGGGVRNAATGHGATVAGGDNNTASWYYSAIGGGLSNTASGYNSAVGGGYSNIASGYNSAVGGGLWNKATGFGSTVGGGDNSTASGQSATVAGGFYNAASGYAATIPGGYADTAAGDYSLASGLNVNITSDANYTFAFGRDFTTSTPNAVIFHNSVDPINVGIGTAAPDEELHVVGSIKMVDGNQAAGKVLTSDANGVGTWQAAAGGMGGSGTANYVPKFTASTTLANSAIYETGSRIGIGTTTPNASSKLHVQHNNLYAGYFTSNNLSHNTRVIHSEFTGSGNYDAAAVYGKCRPADNFGFGGFFEGGYIGVYGEVYPTGSQLYLGVQGYVYGGSGTNRAVGGYAWGGGTNCGVFGYAAGGTTNWAGYFDGNVKVAGTLTKGGGSFQIDHPLDPENKYLFHSFVESPDMMNVYNGNVILNVTGEATVELPAYFETLNRDFRYQLTAIGAPGPNLYISQEISGNSFKIAGGEPGMKVSWQVTGIRHDKFAEANRIQVEVDKPDNERGKYLHPEAYNLGEEYDIQYEEHKQMKERLEKEEME
jgi:hypothetical protein